jgi:hypothetical protein
MIAIRVLTGNRSRTNGHGRWMNGRNGRFSERPKSWPSATAAAAAGRAPSTADDDSSSPASAIDRLLKSRRGSGFVRSLIRRMSPFGHPDDSRSWSSYLRLGVMLTTIGMLAVAGVAGAQRSPTAKSSAHEHHAPHGGTLVELGEEFAHLELVLNAQTGTLTAYILDGEAEQSVRIVQPQIEVNLRLPGSAKALALTLPAAANPLTGETVGQSSQFQAHAEALKGATRFTGTVKSVTAKGGTFENVSFQFPEGNEH